MGVDGVGTGLLDMNSPFRMITRPNIVNGFESIKAAGYHDVIHLFIATQCKSNGVGG